jgi:5-methylcytosine-specific restriction endonuclease McrA
MMFSRHRREIVFNKFDGKCAYCGCKIEIENYHIDHFVPTALKGDSSIDNLNPACSDCNLSKHSLSIEEFRTKLENLIYKNTSTRLLGKYHDLERKKITFLYEER